MITSRELTADDDKFIKIKIEICDTGVGIKKENLGNLFMDFSRLQEHSEMNPSGTGLGLSICKRMIEQMGGKVSVDSTFGEGTTFCCELTTQANYPPSEQEDQQSPERELQGDAR